MDADIREFLEDAAQRQPPDLVELSIRELLDRWGHKRRGYWVVTQMEGDLDEAGLGTEPSFTQGWIDARIKLVPKQFLEPTRLAAGDEAVAPPGQDEVEPGEVGLIVGSLRSASQQVSSVPLDGSLLEAQSLMMSNDYSQLAVMSNTRDLRGAITWESIAQGSMRLTEPQVRDCLIQVETVRFEDDLVHHIPRIVQAGYVFVRAQDQSISGIVTTSDLSEEFARLATPFFLIGEIERRLRRAVDRIFSPEELSQVQNPQDATRNITSAGDLTIGECMRLLEHPERWEKTGWHADRKVFIEDLDRVRELRNDVMHFSPDPLDEEQIDVLRLFIRWLKILDP